MSPFSVEERAGREGPAARRFTAIARFVVSLTGLDTKDVAGVGDGGGGSWWARELWEGRERPARCLHEVPDYIER